MSGVLNLLLAGAASAIKDAYFNLTTLLLNTSSTNGAQNNTFLDSSSSPLTITRNGNTTQGTFTPFSQTGWGNYLQGSSSGFSFTSITIGASQCTFEGWIYVPSFSSIQHMYGGTSTNSDISIEITNATTITIDCSFVGNQQFTVASMATNTWHHIVFVRNASVATVFVDGVRSSTGAVANTITYAGFSYIGYKSSGYALTGYVSNMRVVKAAVYDPTQTTIVVPTSPLSAVSNTVLLTCQSNRFVDNSGNSVALTANNSPSVQAFSPFAPTAAYDSSVVGGSGYFDGSGDSLTTSSSANLAIGTSDFCIEWFYYQTSTQTSATPFCQWGGGATDWILQYNSSTFIFYYAGGANSISYAYTPVPNQWTHACVCRSGTTMSLYLNGTRVATKTDSTSIPNTRGLVVGRNPDGGQDCTGYIAYPRLVVGSSVYTPSSTTLTVPTAPLTAISGTKFLCAFTNTGIFDATAKNDLETAGNAQVSTTQAKWGTTSMYFGALGNYLTTPYSPNLVFRSGDFSFECWLYWTGGGGENNLIMNNASGGFNIKLSASTATNWALENAYVGQVADFGTAPTKNTWHHIAVTRSSGTLYAFIDGTQVYSGANSTDFTNTATWYIASNGYSSSLYITGYIDDLRITKGYARYTANFTPPTAALPLQ